MGLTAPTSAQQYHDYLYTFKSNNEAWHFSDLTQRKKLEEKNREIAAALGAGTYNASTGKYSNIMYDANNKVVIPAWDAIKAMFPTKQPATAVSSLGSAIATTGVIVTKAPTNIATGAATTPVVTVVNGSSQNGIPATEGNMQYAQGQGVQEQPMFGNLGSGINQDSIMKVIIVYLGVMTFTAFLSMLPKGRGK